MIHLRFLAFSCVCANVLLASQLPTDRSSVPEPTLPVVDYKACPFEGCTFRKWVIAKDVALYSTWKKDRKQVTTAKRGQVVTGFTGVHITYAPDQVRVLQSLPELGLQSGDTILRYM